MGGQKRKRLKEVKEGFKVDEGILQTEGTLAEVIEIIGRTGARGEATQVMLRILEGSKRGKILRRNVKGPVRIGMKLRLKDTEIEAAPLAGKKKEE